MKYPLIIGNWKLNGNRNMLFNFIKSVCKELKQIKNCNIAIAPPLVYLELARNLISDNDLLLAAQNVDIHFSGAFTGETSVEMLDDIGAKYVIIGHSERRIYHKENNDIIAKKFSLVKNIGLIPILCIGENEVENQSGQTKEVCAHQIDSILKYHNIKSFKDTVIAYEPYWAIGTGKAATPKYAQKIHNFIRNHIAKKDQKIAEQITIQYGGSVDDKNAKEFLVQPDIDGALIGGASLKANIFLRIIKTATAVKSSINQ